jgi:hypothetical protein
LQRTALPRFTLKRLTSTAQTFKRKIQKNGGVQISSSKPRRNWHFPAPDKKYPKQDGQAGNHRLLEWISIPAMERSRPYTAFRHIFDAGGASPWRHSGVVLKDGQIRLKACAAT